MLDENKWLYQFWIIFLLFQIALMSQAFNSNGGTFVALPSSKISSLDQDK